jgi:hypothetical protein
MSADHGFPRWIGRTAAALGLVLASVPAGAREPCKVLCAPSLKLEPTVTFSNLFRRHRVRAADGTTERAAREAAFEVILALDVPTALPRVGLTVEAIWTPFGTTSANPFTGRTAQELGVPHVRDNTVELEFELNLKWLLPEQTGGWVGSHFDIVDKFSPAERPGDTSTYTHKLNLELDTAVSVFRWLPEGHWLRDVELEGSLDYVATGLPRAGDELPGGDVYLDDASRWSFSLVFVIPIAPR